MAYRSLFDLLPWGHFVAPGVLRNRDGSLAAAFELSGPDGEAASALDVRAAASALEKAVRGLGEGWLLHLDSFRTRSSVHLETAFSHPLAAALDRQREAELSRAGALYETRSTAVLTRAPLRPARSLLDEAAQIADFERKLAGFLAQLAASFRRRRLGSEAFLAYLYRCLTFEAAELHLGEEAVDLEHYLGVADFAAQRYPECRLGEHFLAVLSVRGYPDSVRQGFFSSLSTLPHPLRFCLRFVPLHPERAAEQAERRTLGWGLAGMRLRNVAAPPRDRRNPDAFSREMAARADRGRSEMLLADTSAGFLDAGLVLWDRDPEVLQERAQACRAHLVTSLGCSARIETWGAPEAFLGTLPSCGHFSVHRPLVPTPAFTAFAPILGTWAGHRRHPHPRLRSCSAQAVVLTDRANPFHLALGHEDLLHAVLLGTTGTGKSTLGAFLVYSFLRYDARVWVIDKGWSYAVLAAALGGLHAALSLEQGGDGPRFAPLAHIDTEDERLRAAEWLEALFAFADPRLGELLPHHKGRIRRAVDELAASERRTLTLLSARLQDRELRAALAPYTGSGPYAHLFDAERSTLGSAPLQVLEFQRISGHREALLGPLLLHLFDLIDRGLDGTPTLIFVEEAFNWLQHPIFARRLEAWLYELRKRNAGLVVITQTPTTITRSPIAEAVLDSCGVLLACGTPKASLFEEDYTRFGLDAQKVALLASLEPRREYLFHSPDGCRRIDLALSPELLAFVGVSGEDARRVLRDFDLSTPAGLAAYLRSRGLEPFTSELRKEAS